MEKTPRPWSGTLNLRVINKEGTEYGPGQGDRAQPAGLGWREVTATDGVWGQASLGSGGWMQGLWGGPGRSKGREAPRPASRGPEAEGGAAPSVGHLWAPAPGATDVEGWSGHLLTSCCFLPSSHEVG